MMRTTSALCVLLACSADFAHASEPSPAGPLPDIVRPTAYRLNFTMDPAAERFSGHTQIDAVLMSPARSFYLHGQGLQIGSASVRSGQSVIIAHYTETGEPGVARLEFPKELPAGKLTLDFDYTAEFQTTAAGAYHFKVGGDWYVATQGEPIGARRMFPGFDEPRFKTPFTVTVTAPSAAKVFANAPEAAVETSGVGMSAHHFSPTRPLPTYLLALGIGPFDVVATSVGPNAARKQAIPFRAIATKGQLERMRLITAEGPKLLGLLEAYLGAYPYEKLDYLATPIHPGGMENAGLIIINDSGILFDANPPASELRDFAEFNAHEMAHQWFGDLVTPVWWTDLWLNESFAEWMGKKAAHQWRPDLGIAVDVLKDALSAMDLDSLARGRPIHQPIPDSRHIAQAIDSVTYGKGAQVLSMFESFLGPDRFAAGIRLYLQRRGYGNATAEDFFGDLAEGSREPKVVAALRTFTDQSGVPVVSVVESPTEISLSQARYRPLGVKSLDAQTWEIPVCLSRGEHNSCTLLETHTARLPPIPGSGALMPNARGAGYYRFSLDGPGWDRLIAASATLPGAEALAVADSLWADFAAGNVSFDRLIAGARALSQSPEHLAALQLAERLRGLANTVLTADQLPKYRMLMSSIYGPRLMSVGLDLRPGAHSGDPVAKQLLRQSLVPLVAFEARDPALRARLTAAAVDWLSGDAKVLDPAFQEAALSVAVQDCGVPFIRQLERALAQSSNASLRERAVTALGSADTVPLASTTLDLLQSRDLEPSERLQIVRSLTHQPTTRELAISYAERHFHDLIQSMPPFLRAHFMGLFGEYCTSEAIAKINAFIQPRLQELGGGELELARTVESVGRCVALRTAKREEIGAWLARYEH